jgi:hypothetical protein
MNPMISELRTDLSFAFRTMSADAIHAKRLLVLLHGVGASRALLLHPEESLQFGVPLAQARSTRKLISSPPFNSGIKHRMWDCLDQTELDYSLLAFGQPLDLWWSAKWPTVEVSFSADSQYLQSCFTHASRLRTSPSRWRK